MLRAMRAPRRAQRRALRHAPCPCTQVRKNDEIEEQCEDAMDDAGWDAAKKDSKRAIELNNGRAAQMGILALMVHEKLDNNPYMINGLLGAPVDFNAGF